MTWQLPYHLPPKHIMPILHNVELFLTVFGHSSCTYFVSRRFVAQNILVALVKGQRITSRTFTALVALVNTPLEPVIGLDLICAVYLWSTGILTIQNSHQIAFDSKFELIFEPLLSPPSPDPGRQDYRQPSPTRGPWSDIGPVHIFAWSELNS